MGLTEKEIKQKLGFSRYEIVAQDKSYLIYEHDLEVFASIWPFLPVAPGSHRMICSKLEFGSDQRLAHFEVYPDPPTFHAAVGIPDVGGVGTTGYVPPERDSPDNCKEVFWPEGELVSRTAGERIEVEKRARAGDLEAMYQYANHLKIGSGLKRIKWYCLAAHKGHAKSQYQLGRYHHHGYVIEKNAAQGFLWYTLSLETEESSEVANQRRRLSEQMTPAQIAEAERLVAEWGPNPAECEEIAPQSEN